VKRNLLWPVLFLAAVVAGGRAGQVEVRAQTPPTGQYQACGGKPWRFEVPVHWVRSPARFRQNGGQIFPKVLARARSLPHVKWFVAANTYLPSISCIHAKQTIIEVGVNSRRGTYLFAVSTVRTIQ
jgi:hypothetical protein